MANNPAKYEVPIKQNSRLILNISVGPAVQLIW